MIETSDGGEKSRKKIQLEIPVSHPNEDGEEAVGYRSWGVRLEPLGVVCDSMTFNVITLGEIT